MTRKQQPMLWLAIIALAATANAAYASVAGTPPANRPPARHYTLIRGHLSPSAWRRAYIAKFHHPPMVMKPVKSGSGPVGH